MKLKTQNFGEVEISEEEIFNFDDGLPGFPEHRRFVLISEEDSPVVSFLQSVDEERLSFVVVDMMVLMPEYDPNVEEEQIKDLGEYNPEDFLVYNVCTIYDDLKNSTVNLKAPIVINAAQKKGKQVVCSNEEYSVKAPLFVGVPEDEGGGIC